MEDYKYVEDTRKIKSIVLRNTCFCCPEQYDAYLNGIQVGYLRLRHGRFTVECPDTGGDLVYSGYPQGDGMFDSNEREFFLNEAVDCIEAWIKEEGGVGEIGSTQQT